MVWQELCPGVTYLQEHLDLGRQRPHGAPGVPLAQLRDRVGAQGAWYGPNEAWLQQLHQGRVEGVQAPLEGQPQLHAAQAVLFPQLLQLLQQGDMAVAKQTSSGLHAAQAALFCPGSAASAAEPHGALKDWSLHLRTAASALQARE